MLVVFSLLLLLSTGHALFPDSGERVRRVPMYDGDRFSGMTAVEKYKAFTATLHGLVQGSDESLEVVKPSSRRNIVQTPTDDEDLKLVVEYLQDKPFNKTGQLRYSSVPVVEQQLVEDILDVIFSREDYLRLLNNPEESAMVEIIKEMIRLPTQQVLKQQLLHKILAGRAFYEKFVNPLLQDNKRQKLLEFGQHLLEANNNGTLSTEDTKEFNNQLTNIAFFDRPEDKEFRGMVDQLMHVFGESMNITKENQTTVAPESFTTEEEVMHRKNYNLVNEGTTTRRATTTKDLRITTERILTTTGRYAPTRYTKSDTTTRPTYVSTGNPDDYMTTTPRYVPTSTRGEQGTTTGPVFVSTDIPEDLVTTVPRYTPTSSNGNHGTTTRPVYVSTSLPDASGTTTTRYVPTPTRGNRNATTQSVSAPTGTQDDSLTTTYRYAPTETTSEALDETSTSRAVSPKVKSGPLDPIYIAPEGLNPPKAADTESIEIVATKPSPLTTEEPIVYIGNSEGGASELVTVKESDDEAVKRNFRSAVEDETRDSMLRLKKNRTFPDALNEEKDIVPLSLDNENKRNKREAFVNVERIKSLLTTQKPCITDRWWDIKDLPIECWGIDPIPGEDTSAYIAEMEKQIELQAKYDAQERAAKKNFREATVDSNFNGPADEGSIIPLKDLKRTTENPIDHGHAGGWTIGPKDSEWTIGPMDPESVPDVDLNI